MPCISFKREARYSVGSGGRMLDTIRKWADTHTQNTLRIILILGLAWLVLRVLRSVIKRIERISGSGDPHTTTELEKRAHTISRVLRQASSVLVWSVTIMLVLAEFGVDLKPILAGAGILGLAVGFGAQTLVKDVITGFFILLENQILVGDTITAAGCTGVVESVNLRTTILRDVDGTTHIIPNSAITVVTNATRDWARALLDVGVAYKEDTDRCEMVLREVGAAMEKDSIFGKKLIGSFEYPGVVKLGDSAVVLRVLVKTHAHDGPAVLREMRRRVKQAFDKADIEIPFPHVKVVRDREGAA
jgi:small conductance mechanosensitive channel